MVPIRESTQPKGFPGGTVVKNLLPKQEVQEVWVWSLGWEDPLEMATGSSILVWKTPWREGPGRLQFMGLQKGRDWATEHAHMTQHKPVRLRTW